MRQRCCGEDWSHGRASGRKGGAWAAALLGGLSFCAAGRASWLGSATFVHEHAVGCWWRGAVTTLGSAHIVLRVVFFIPAAHVSLRRWLSFLAQSFVSIATLSHAASREWTRGGSYVLRASWIRGLVMSICTLYTRRTSCLFTRCLRPGRGGLVPLHADALQLVTRVAQQVDDVEQGGRVDAARRLRGKWSARLLSR